MPMEGRAHAKVAGHAIHALLMLGQHLVCWRVACMQSDPCPLQAAENDVLMRLVCRTHATSTAHAVRALLTLWQHLCVACK